MAHYLETKGVKLLFQASGLSWATGKIENVGHWVQSVIQKCLEEVTNWDLELPHTYENVNNHIISHLRYSPCKIQFGLDASHNLVTVPQTSPPAEITPEVHTTKVQMHIEYLMELHDHQFQVQMSQEATPQQKSPSLLSWGTLVFVKYHDISKLQPCWRGPFVITEPSSNQNASYSLAHLNSHHYPYSYS